MTNLKKIKVVILGGNSVSTRIGMLLGDQGLEVVSINQSSDIGIDYAGFKRSQTWVENTNSDSLRKLLNLSDVIVDAGVSSLEFKLNPASIYCRVSGCSALLPEDTKIGVATAIYDVPLLKAPRFHSLPIPSTVTACWAVIGIMAGLISRNRDGRGQVIDVEMEDATVTTHELIALLTHKPPTAFQPMRWAASPFMSIHKTSDEYIYTHLGLSSHLDLFLDKLGNQAKLLKKIISPKTRNNPASVSTSRELFKIQTELRKIFITRTSLAWENDFDELCIASTRTPEQWLGSEVARSGEFIVKLAGQDTIGTQVDTSHASIEQAKSTTIEHLVHENWPVLPEPKGDIQKPPLDGVRVLDFTAVIAGPIAGRTLADLGAQVIRIDKPWELPNFLNSFHLLFDRNKQGVFADIRNKGILQAVFSKVDPHIVIQNFRPGVADKLGIIDLFNSKASTQTLLSISAFGSKGIWGRRPGWEQTVQAVTGMQADYGKSAPELLPVPVNDLCTGLLGAYGALMTHFNGGGKVSTSLTAIATFLLAPRLLNGIVPEDGWKKAREWEFHHQKDISKHANLKQVLESSSIVKRTKAKSIGEYTEIQSPLCFSRTKEIAWGAKERGWATKKWLDNPPQPPEFKKRDRENSRIYWWLSRIRWIITLVWSRIR